MWLFAGKPEDGSRTGSAAAADKGAF